MRPNRKADLQRRLALVPVPKPPAGLAERIKKDIPKHLAPGVEKERERLRQSVAFNVRVAASIILLVSSLYLTLHLLSRSYKPAAVDALQRQATPVPVKVAAASERDAAPQNAVVTAPVSSPAPVPSPAETKEEGRADNRKRALEPRPQREKVAAYQEPAFAPPAAPTSAPVPAAVAEDMARGGLAAAKASKTSAYLNKLSSARDESALIERFAAPESRPVGDLRLDAEAATAPLDSGALIVRFSIDAPESDAASEVILEVAFNDEVLNAKRVISAPRPTQSLGAAESVTALYEVTLKGTVAADERIATATVRYRLSDHESRTIERTIHGGDIRPFDGASKRMKAASLAAALPENPAAVAAKAREAGLLDLAAAAEKKPIR